MKRKILIGLVVLTVGAGTLLGCVSGPAIPNVSNLTTISANEAKRKAGDVIGVEYLKGYNKLMLGFMLQAARLPVKTKVTDGVSLFRVRYLTEVGGKLVEASGLMSLPYATLRGQTPRGTVMYLHGTSPSRANSPSAPALAEGVLPTAVFAGGGYILLAPDYIGLGTSKSAPAYLHTAITAGDARSLVIASQTVAKALKVSYSPDLYLVGFSQGGHATALIQRAFEAAPVPGATVKAASAIAGAYDLVGISIPYAIRHKHSLYLGYLATSYSVQYNQPPETLFASQYATSAPKLFDGDHSEDALIAGLPADPRDLFLPERLTEIETGGANWFVTALNENEAFRWSPKAPIRLYYGDLDTDVSPEDSKNFYATATKLGGNVKLMPIGAYGHSESAYHGVPLSRIWFDELSAKDNRR